MIKIKESSFKNETECQKNYKQIVELETMIYEKIEENVRLNDELETHLNPIITPKQLDDLKDLVKELSKDKSNMYHLYFDTQQKYIKIANETDEMKSKIDYSNYIVEKLKFHNHSLSLSL